MVNWKELEARTCNIRKNIVRMVTAAKSGHPGGSLSAVEILTAIYFTQMNLDQTNVDALKRNKFVLSKGHASPVLYAVLAEKGFIDEADLLSFRKIDSPLQGHPSMRMVKGVDMSTGSLGQGISAAVGMALANQVHGDPYRVYALLGDGECEEGQVWEAAMAAAHYHLDNLLVFVDHNGLQIDGDVTKVMNPTPLDEKFKAFGWNVIVLEDGNDLKQVVEACESAKTVKGKPSVVIAKTVKGKGVSFMENQVGWHGAAPNDEQYEVAMEDLRKAGEA